MNPDYVKWLKKPCWSELEIFYLISGVDPSRSMEHVAVLVVDPDSGESWPALPDESAITLAGTPAGKAKKDPEQAAGVIVGWWDGPHALDADVYWKKHNVTYREAALLLCRRCTGSIPSGQKSAPD